MSRKIAFGYIAVTLAAIAAVIVIIVFFNRNNLSVTRQMSEASAADGEITGMSAIVYEAYSQNSRALQNPLEVDGESVKLYVAHDGDGEKIRRTLAEIKALSDEICEGTDEEYEKLRAISLWVSENIYYDYDARNGGATAETYSLAHVLEARRSICFGYANLTAALCRAQGIDCRVAHGTASPSGFDRQPEGSPHEWNVAVIGGKMIWLDPLWDTTNSYVDGEYFKGVIDVEYFDVSGEALAINHRAERIDIRDYFAESDFASR